MTINGTLLTDTGIVYGRMCIHGGSLLIDQFVGYGLGFSDGAIDGLGRGLAVGIPIGRAAGEEDGYDDGERNGMLVGIGIGALVPLAVTLGFTDGLVAGFTRGFSVGREFDPEEEVRPDLIPPLSAPTAPGAGSGDTTPPTISDITPTPGVLPGAAGGFSADPNTARSTPIQFDVFDLAPGIAGVIVMGRFNDPLGLSHPTFVVHNGTRFLPPFNAASTRTGSAIAGYHFSVIRNSGWSLDGDPSIHLDIVPIDAAGNITGGLPT